MEFRYKGLEATLEQLAVTEEELDRQVERLKGQDMGDLTPEQIRQGVAEALQAHYDEQAEAELRLNLLRMAAETLDYVPSEAAVQDELDRQMGLLSEGLAEKNLSLTDYCGFVDTTPEKLREDLRGSAEHQLREEAAVERIAALECITVNPTEIEAKIDPGATEEGKMYARYLWHSELLRRKVLEFLRENAKITLKKL
jgi:FKBP-type peptidyl-prolyl cis-trans isomerase (trigger factor)